MAINKDRAVIAQLGYEQLLALRIVRDHHGKEATALAKEADCSWDELFDLAEKGLIDLCFGRLEARVAHPVITESGIAVVCRAEADGSI